MTRIPPSILLFKINSLGNVEWQKQFNGAATGGATVAGLVQTSDGGYVFAAAQATYCMALKATLNSLS